MQVVKKGKPKRPPTKGAFVKGDDSRRVAGQFKTGPDPRRAVGGRSKRLRDFSALLREKTPEDIKAELDAMLKCGHEPTRLGAWKEQMRWGFGAPAPEADDDLPDDKDLQLELEKQLKRRALAGDLDAALIVLRALDPAKYGKDDDKGQGGGGPDDVDVIDWAPAIKAAP